VCRLCRSLLIRCGYDTQKTVHQVLITGPEVDGTTNHPGCVVRGISERTRADQGGPGGGFGPSGLRAPAAASEHFPSALLSAREREFNTLGVDTVSLVNEVECWSVGPSRMAVPVPGPSLMITLSPSAIGGRVYVELLRATGCNSPVGFRIGAGPSIVIRCPARTPMFTAIPNDDGATVAVTTNCGQLPMPNSVIGAATVTTARDGVAREAPGAIGGKPTRTAYLESSSFCP
jgi:hypothetical protein